MDEVYKTANKASQLLESGACLLHTAKPNCTDVPHVRSVALAYGAFLHVPAYHAAAPCLAVHNPSKVPRNKAHAQCAIARLLPCD